MSDAELELVAKLSTALEKANFPTPLEDTTPLTRQEAMEELTVRLNNARKMREFAFGNWGDKSSYKLWEKDARLYDYLLENLKDSTPEAQVATSASAEAN